MWGSLAGPNVMRSSSMPYYDKAGIVGFSGAGSTTHFAAVAKPGPDG